MREQIFQSHAAIHVSPDARGRDESLRAKEKRLLQTVACCLWFKVFDQVEIAELLNALCSTINQYIAIPPLEPLEKSQRLLPTPG